MTATTTAPLATASVRATRKPPSDRIRAWATRAPLLPALIFMIAVTQLPFVATLVISFFDWNSSTRTPATSRASATTRTS